MMTKAKALKLAREKWGKDRAFVRDYGEWLRDGSRRPASDEERAAAKVEFLALKESEPKFLPLADWPADTPLGEYRATLSAFKKAHMEWRTRKDWVQGLQWCHRYDVGTYSSIFTETKGSGDSWEQALEKAGILVAVEA